jgi:hypothetical protein
MARRHPAIHPFGRVKDLPCPGDLFGVQNFWNRNQHGVSLLTRQNLK